MKKILTMAFIAAALAFGGCAYDDDDLWNKVNEIDDRLTTLEETVRLLNKDIEAMDVIVSALEEGCTITDVTETADGYAITFDNGEAITIKHGTNGAEGAAGADGLTLGVDLYTDGHYYWTQTTGGETTWFPTGENKLRVTGDAGATPELGVDEDGYWTVTVNDVTTRVKDAGGDPVRAAGADGDSFFESVVESADGTGVTITLKDGSVFEIPKKHALRFVIEGAQPENVFAIEYGTTKVFNVVEAGVSDYTIAKPDGWKAGYANGKLSVTAPAQGNSYADQEGEIAVLVVSETGASIISKVRVMADTESYMLHTVTFEGDYWEPFVAANYSGATYTNTLLNGKGTYSYPLWVDATTQLTTQTPSGATSMGYDYPFMLSSYNSNDIAGYGGYQTDLYVYNSNNATATKGGGRNGSDNFIVGFGHEDLPPAMSWGDWRTILEFKDGVARTVRSIYVNSTNYFLSVVADGNGLSPALAPGEDVTLYATGYDADGNKVGEVTMLYANCDMVVTEWTEWDLSGLGDVVRIKVNIGGGTDNGYGFSLPAYYAFDDITVVIK